ncbi:MAG: hypothetical protein ACI87O_001918 [Planctomycetota bacterium]|jgi:uncharacterized protein YfaS (alpha-2-macroglobulin family)
MNQGGITGTKGHNNDQNGKDRVNGGTQLSQVSSSGTGGPSGRAKFWVLAFALVLVNGLGWYWSGGPVQAAEDATQDSVHITRVEPRFSVEQVSEFRLFFDRDMCDESRVGQRLAASPFTLTPERAGQWKWATPSELVFELTEPLPMGRRFELAASPAFKDLTGFQLIGEQSFQRMTAGLQVKHMTVESSDPDSTTLKLSFNQPVDPGDLAKHLEILMDDQELDDWRVLNTEPHKETLVRVGYPKKFAGLTLDLHISKDLHGSGAQLGLAQAFKESFSIPRGFTAIQVNARPDTTANTCSVSVRFNEPLALGQETPTLTFEPAVECGPAHIRGRELKLSGAFQCGQTYKVRVGEALLGAGGLTLGKTAPLSFKVPERSQRISLPDGGGLLMPGGQLQLALEITNVPKLKISASRLHANNLVSHLHHNGTRETSRQAKTQHFELDLQPNVITQCSLPLEEIVDDPLGVYRITVHNGDSYWPQKRVLVRVSDLALTVKRESQGLFVWVTSLKTGEPLAGVSLEARTSNNQVLGRALSSDQGVARIEFPAELPDGGAFVVSATLGRDFAYLRPDGNTWAFDKVHTAGRDFASKVDAWLYTECGVYRPGETMHLTGVLRAPDGGFAEQGRFEVRLRRPDGRLDWRATLEGDSAPDSQGMFQIDLPTRREGFTGLHTIALWDLDAKKTLQKTRVNVEDFVPTRLELGTVATVLDTPRVQPVEASSPRVPRGVAPGSNAHAARRQAAPLPRRRIAIDVDSKDFLGRPSKGLALRVLPHWTRQIFESEAHPDFQFKEPKDLAQRSFQAREQLFALDDTGRARVELHPGQSQVPGFWKLRAAATVTENGGRSATHSVKAELDTAHHHLGFRLRGDVAPVAEPIAIDWLFVGRDGLETDPRAYSLRLEQVVSEYGMENVNGRLSWKSKVRRVDVGRFAIGEKAGRGSIEFQVREAGHYRLLAQTAEGDTQAEFTFYAGEANATKAPTDPQLLELTLDRDKYLPGDAVQLQVRGEFDGRLLVTLENDRVLNSQVIEFQAPVANLSLELPDSLRGGAFVSASLIRAIDTQQTSWLPHRAKGLVRIPTHHRDHILPLAVEAPERMAPGETVSVRVTSLLPDLELLNTVWLPKVAKPMEASAPRKPTPPRSTRPARLHVWAVDTGVLLATAEKLPDPHAHFFAQRKSGVGTSDSWAQLLPDHMRAASVLRIGGDLDETEAMARRLAALPATARTSPVAWSRAVDLGPDRSALIELVLPEIRGAVTLRAVLVEGDSYACHEQRIELATDLQITATWPRYATSGDRFRIPVKVLNTTDAPMRAVLDAAYDGPVTFAMEAGSATLDLGAGEETTVWFQCTTPESGQAHLELLASHTGGTEKIQTEFQVRPATALHQETQLLQVDATKIGSLDVAKGFEDRGLRASVEIAGSSQIELRPALRALIDYPHGCLEQTTSRLFALVNAGALLEDSGDTDKVEGTGTAGLVRSMVRSGIHRLHAMQTRSGGLSYWMGDSTPSAWGSAYAASFLVEARRAGFEVPASLSKPLMDYLAKQLRAGKESLGNQALMCRVLAAFGRPHEGWMTRIQERLTELDVAGRAHLASAWLQLGRRDRALECLSQDTLALVSPKTFSGRITSQIGQEGTLLGTLIDLDPEHAWIPIIANRLHKARKNGRWSSTLEDASALSALARYQALQPAVADFSGTLITGSGERHAFDSSRASRFTFDATQLVGTPLTIEVAGQGRAFVVVHVEGTPTDPVAAYDHNLVVRRRLLDVNGVPLAADQALKVGDLIQVEVELSCNALNLPNVAIVDALPAGLEVENPRLANSAKVVGPGSTHADRVEFREDRVIIFASARRTTSTFRYNLRATLAGQYAVPPIQASSMYDPGIASLGAAGSLRVERPSK